MYDSKTTGAHTPRVSFKRERDEYIRIYHQTGNGKVGEKIERRRNVIYVGWFFFLGFKRFRRV